MLITSNEYLQAVQEINDYVNQAKYRASVSVNSEVLKTNLFIGSVIIRNSEWEIGRASCRERVFRAV